MTSTSSKLWIGYYNMPLTSTPIDIHLEPRRDIGKVRFRIDGVLHTVYEMPAGIMTAVIARIKILGRLNVAEKRKPQDGRLKTRTPKGKKRNYACQHCQPPLVKKWSCACLTPKYWYAPLSS